MPEKLSVKIISKNAPSPRNCKGITTYGSANCDHISFPLEDTRALMDLRGSFAMVVESPDSVTLICDPIRSIPLFYSVTHKGIVVGCHGVAVAEECGMELDQEAATEFLYARYVTGIRTLFKNVYAVNPGEILRISREDGSVSRRFYYELLYCMEGREEVPVSRLIEEFDACLEDVFRDLAKRLNGRPVLIPLSAGCDSRTAAVMFKRIGYPDVACFYIGRKINRDAATSRAIAENLGYPWVLAETTNERWGKLYQSDVYSQYLEYSCNGNSMGTARTFLGPLIVKDRFQDRVVVPGHTLDVEMGSHLPAWSREKEISREMLTAYNIQWHYSLRLHPEKCAASIRRWSEKLPEKMDAAAAIREFQHFEWLNRQPKFIVNELRMYEFLQFAGWEIPFWDTRVCDFATKLTPFQLEGRNFQYRYMEKIINPLAGIQQTYPAAGEVPEKTKTSRFQELKACLRRYRDSGLSLYGHMSFPEYLNWVRKCGTYFNIHAKTAEDGLNRILAKYHLPMP